MPDNKDNLKKLLDFLKEGVINKPENSWFVEELRKSLPVDKAQKLALSENCAASRIEKYLALDYMLDTKTLAIDYSFVKDEYLRNCFEADCREMLRFRFGLRGHKVDFGEFCRYAFMQIERIINVHYNQCGNSIRECINYLRSLNDKINQNYNSVESIPFGYKWFAFRDECQLDGGFFNSILNLSKIRNHQSHGGTINPHDENFFWEYQSKLKNQGCPLYANGKVNWYALKENNSLNETFGKNIQNTNDYKKYNLLCWYRQKPYDEIISSLSNILALEKIKQELSSYKQTL